MTTLSTNAFFATYLLLYHYLLWFIFLHWVLVSFRLSHQTKAKINNNFQSPIFSVTECVLPSKWLNILLCRNHWRFYFQIYRCTHWVNLNTSDFTLRCFRVWTLTLISWAETMEQQSLNCPSLITELTPLVAIDQDAYFLRGNRHS